MCLLRSLKNPIQQSVDITNITFVANTIGKKFHPELRMISAFHA